MASTSATAFVASFNIASPVPASSAFPQPRPLGLARPAVKLAVNRNRVFMSAGNKEFNAGGATALALLAAAVIPEIAEAAQPGVSPSLKNFLLSIVAGGVVLLVIGGAVTAVSTFDPITRK